MNDKFEKAILSQNANLLKHKNYKTVHQSIATMHLLKHKSNFGIYTLTFNHLFSFLFL